MLAAFEQVFVYTGVPAHPQRPYDLLNALGVLFVIASAWPVARRFGVAYAAFILVNILPPLSTGGLMSAGRFSSVLFPAFFLVLFIILLNVVGDALSEVLERR